MVLGGPENKWGRIVLNRLTVSLIRLRYPPLLRAICLASDSVFTWSSWVSI